MTKIYNADIEEPDCGICDRMCSEACDRCGPEYGWNNYRRTEGGVPIEEDYSDKDLSDYWNYRSCY